MSQGRPKKDPKDKTNFKKISVYEHTYNDIKKIAKKQDKHVCVLIEDIIKNY